MLQRRTPLKRTGSLKRSPLRRVSKRRAVELREYAKRREIYLASNPICEVWLREHGWFAVKQCAAPAYEKTGVDGQYFAEGLVQLGAPRSTEIHHTNKRRGKMLNDERYWLAVSRANHERIELNLAWARREGYLLNF